MRACICSSPPLLFYDGDCFCAYVIFDFLKGYLRRREGRGSRRADQEAGEAAEASQAALVVRPQGHLHQGIRPGVYLCTYVKKYVSEHTYINTPQFLA